MNTKHTPGPWKVITEAAALEVDVFEVAEISHFRVIPDRPDTWSAQGDALADARLIAAAPDLLAALEELLTDMVIAQGNMRHAAKRDQSWEGCAEAIEPRCAAARAAITKATGGQP